MPFDLKLLGKEGRRMFREWKKEQAQYDTEKVRKQFKDRDGNLEKYDKEIRSMNEKYRKVFKEEEQKTKKAMKELDQMRKEEELLLKVAEEKIKEAALVKRRLNKEKKKIELSKVVPRRSSRFAPKKRGRCPNGTRRSKKTGNCEKNTDKKRCPNGTRKNKKTGDCDKK